MSLENKQVFELNENSLDQKKLKDEFITDISEKYKISKNTTEQLINLKSETNLVQFKEELNNLRDINNQGSDLPESEENIDILFHTIKGAREIIEKSSEIDLNILQNEIISVSNIAKNNSINAFFPKKLINKAQNPDKLHQHILGFALGTATSAFTTIEMAYKVGIGAIKAPYHLYMIIADKATTNSFKNI